MNPSPLPPTTPATPRQPAARRLGLSGQFALLALVAALTAIGNILLVTNALQRLDGVAEQVNVAGRLRMLSQKLALESTRRVLLADDSRSLQQAVVDYERALTSLERGGAAFGLQVPAVAAVQRAPLDRLRAEWDHYRAVTEALLRRPDPSTLQPLHAQTASLLASAERLVGALTIDARNTQRWLLGSLIGLLGVQLLGLTAVTLAVRRRVVRPLLRLAESAGQLAAGNYRGVTVPLPPNELGQVGAALDQARHRIGELVTRLEQLASCDPLTGLANRTALQRQLDQAGYQAARHPRRMAVLLIDLDNFKQVNDRRGHAVGDLLLQEVAARLTAQVRGGDLLARLGGDEFVVLMPAIDTATDAAATAERLLAALETPIAVGDSTFAIGLSIGIALYPDDGASDTLLDKADQAMYDIKRQGRGGYCFHDADAPGATL